MPLKLVSNPTWALEILANWPGQFSHSGFFQKCSLCERVETYMQILHGFLVLSELMLCSFMIQGVLP